jgi:hypothetical protein
MVTVPAENMLDQLTSYVRVSPGWNAWIPAGGGAIVCRVTDGSGAIVCPGPDGSGAIVCSAAPDRDAAIKCPEKIKQITADVRKSRLDPIFTGHVI